MTHMRGVTRNIEDKFITRKIVVVFRTALFLLKLTIFQKINSLMIKKKKHTHTHTRNLYNTFSSSKENFQSKDIKFFSASTNTKNCSTANFHIQFMKSIHY